jgi:hypothetical protein
MAMLGAFWAWGYATPWLVRKGWPANRLMAWGMPVSFVVLGGTIVATQWLPWLAGVMLAAYCVSCSCVTLSQPAVGMAFPPALAGRALSAFNLVIFLGVFVVQWSIGLMIDALGFMGLARPLAFQLAMAVFLACCMVSYGYFLRAAGHNRAT